MITGSADPLVNDFRMRSITPVTLSAGSYSVVAIGFNGGKMNGNSGYSPFPPTTTNSGGGEINFVGSGRYGSGPAFTYPASIDGGPQSRYHAGTFGFAPSSAPVQNTNTGIRYCTIQAAIDDPLTLNGHTILVSPGTYPEAITINKSIHLQGQPGQATNTIIQAPSTLPDASSQNSNIVTVTGTGISAEINGLTISGPGPSGCGSIGNGIFVEGNAYANIHDNRIIDIRDNPFSGCQNGVAIQVGRSLFSTSGTATITNNTITGFQKNGITISNTGSSATISGNTITGAGATSVIAQNGIQVSSGAGGSITNNVISGFSYTPFTVVSCGILVFGPVGTINTNGNTINNSQVAVYYYQASGAIQNNIINYTAAGMGGSPYWYAIDGENGTTTVSGNEITGGGNGAGIEADYVSGETTNMTVLNNKVDNADEGVVIWTDGSGGSATTQIHNNSITNSITSAIHNYGTTNQDATCNWYGSIYASVIATEIQGPVTYIPYLTNGTDSDPATGFQPVPNSCNGPTKQICQQDADQQKKNFDAQQQADKSSFDATQKAQKDNFNAQNPHPTPQQKKAFDDQQKADKKTFDDNQQSTKKTFDQQNDADKKACDQLCDQGQVKMCHDGKNECVPQGDVQKHLAEKGNHWTQGPCSTTSTTNAIAEFTESSDKQSLVPQQYSLSNYPNPFAGTSTIKYDLPYDSKVSIKVYDVMGREVTTLVNNEDKKAGSYSVEFNGSKFSKGSLYYRIIAKSKDKQFEQTNKMTKLQ